MNILHFVFNLIEPKNKVTWLSSSFFRWRLDKQMEYVKNNRDTIKNEYFDVPGAGDIRLSESCHHSTGKVVGFGFGVEWSDTPFIGGVLGRDEAKRLATFIIERCDETKETMYEEKKRIDSERKEYFESVRNEC
jgi:hypothetical protein